MRRWLLLILVALLGVAPPAAAQHAEPAAVRRFVIPAAGQELAHVFPVPSGAFRGDRIGVGMLIGIIVVAPLGWLMERGACEANNCGSGGRGLAAGAAVGAVLGGLFGLIAALPPRGPEPQEVR